VKSFRFVFWGLLCALSLVGCSEGASPEVEQTAAAIVEQTTTRFEVFRSQVKEAAPLARAAGVFKPELQAVAPKKATGAWRAPGPHRLDVELPELHSGVTTIKSGPVTLSLRPVGSQDAPGAVSDDTLVYPDAYQSTDALVVTEQERVEEFLLLRDSRAPRRFAYDLRATRGGGMVRQLEGTVEVLDAQGNAWIRLAPPYLVDGNGEKHEVAAKLEGGRLVLDVPASVSSYPILLDPGWVTTGSMVEEREGHTATRLNSGKVFVVGGVGTMSAELFNPTTGTWTATTSTSIETKRRRDRPAHTATKLASGKVLVVGCDRHKNAVWAQLYDESSGTWGATGKPSTCRENHSAVLLASGKVLIVGGKVDNSLNEKIVEVYSPVTNTWATTASLTSKLTEHQAILIGASGKVLLAGGDNGAVTNASYLYDPSTGTWAATGSMKVARERYMLISLGGGKVLAAGGKSTAGDVASTEIYDSTSASWTLTGQLNAAHRAPRGCSLDKGTIFIFGSKSSNITKHGELYSISSGTWSSLPGLAVERRGHAVVQITNSLVLVAGGDTKTAVYYDATSGNSCQKTSDCSMGFCVDGICCTSACMDTCQVCKVSSSIGKCQLVGAGSQDTVATTTCTGSSACDGKGNCIASGANAQQCSTGTSCGSGICADGLCCNTTCTGTCMACNVTGKLGTCSNLPQWTQDSNATSKCTGNKTCDGLGTCKLSNGQKCSSASQCTSGNCVDGRCCDTACTTTCSACNITGKLGTCSLLANMKTDTYAAVTCSNGKACDGKGACYVVCEGKICTTNLCVDGKCCDTACTGTCTACNVKSSEGKCSNLPKWSKDVNASTTCTGGNACDGQGTCKKIDGQKCSSAIDCVSGYCVDGRCCNSTCTGTCKSCAVMSNEGTCTNVPKWKQDSNALQTCTGNNTCDGKGACRFKNGQTCTSGSQCTSGHCKDGYCCNEACGSTCMTCSRIPGTCSMVLYNNEDKDTKCVSPKVCDGNGKCMLALGQICLNHAQCSSGLCIDGNCCDTACTGACKACNLPGTAGTCTFVTAGQTDPNGSPACTGTSACDGAGGCKKGNGQTCSTTSECATGYCADGVCCDKTCTTACMACNLAATKGTCSYLSSGSKDVNSTPPCTGTSACDGAGNCIKGKGQSCSSGSECVSGHCADGVCCDSACSGTCQACNLLGKSGTCSAMTKGQPDANGSPACTGDKVCDGKGNCLTMQGKTCSGATQCLAGFCRDSVCCDRACDKTCESCALTGSVGTCTYLPPNTYSANDCQGKDPKCGGLCDGSGKCDFPNIGTLCGTCMACDGTGQCTKTPLDDKTCGIIDCDKLDTKCRDYHDLSANRCDSLGSCKTANTTATCTKYTDICNDAGVVMDRGVKDMASAVDVAGNEAGAIPDSGATVDLPPAKEAGAPPDNTGDGTADDGCSVAAGHPAPTGGLLILLGFVFLLGGVPRRTRR